MSAFLCSANHLSLLANAASAMIDTAEKDRVFTVLLAENLRSLQSRYGDEDGDCSEMTRREAPASEIIEEALAKRSARSSFGFAGALDCRALATQIVKACDCYDYQACETSDYETTEAARLISRVRNAAIKIGGQISGTKLYDQLLWGIY